MQKKDKTIARLLKNRIETIPGFKRMVVFGSRARGDTNPESDLDFFIEVSNLDADVRKQVQTAAWEVSLENGVMISTFVASSDAISHSLLAANPLLKSIEMDGIVI